MSEDKVLVHNTNRCKLGKRMQEEKPFGIEDPGNEYDAHHIFPQTFRTFFEKYGIDIDDPFFGLYVELHDHRRGWRAYNDLWEAQIDEWEYMPDFDVKKIFEFLDSLERMW